MILRDLIEELRENILHDRSDRVVDGSDDDRLWSDKTLVRYINQAQRRFARRSLILRDSTTTDLTRVLLRTGVTEYKLDKRVIAVISARYANESADLMRAGHSVLSGYGISPDARFNDPANFTSLPPGKPVAFSTDESIGEDEDGHSQLVTMRFYPQPSAAYASKLLQLRVVKLPTEFTLDDLDQECEIPEDYQLDMLDWAAYLALRMVDLDTGEAGDAAQRSANFRASFEDHVKSAQREVMKKLFTPQSWGFGRNGFSWER